MLNTMKLKQLCLNKTTVAHLNFTQMDGAKGGCTSETIDTCIECDSLTLNNERRKDSDGTCITEPIDRTVVTFG